MVIFGAHAFVKYANNLYTSKILSLKITTTQHLSVFTNIRKIIINGNLCKAHTGRSKSKSAISKIFRPTHFYPKSYELAKVPNKPKAARKGLAETSSKMVQIGQN